MGYAINGNAMRAVEITDALLPGEAYVDQLPTPWPPAPDITALRTTQLATIATAYATAASDNVTDSSGNVWNGGFESAQKLYGATQLAQAGGATTVTLFDVSNVGHSLTIAQATAVAASVGAAFQTAFAKYQGLKVQIAAATTATVQSIVWS